MIIHQRSMAESGIQSLGADHRTRNDNTIQLFDPDFVQIVYWYFFNFSIAIYSSKIILDCLAQNLAFKGRS